MSSPGSISSTTSDDSDHEIPGRPANCHDSHGRIDVARDSTSHWTPSELPLSRTSASQAESNHSGQMLAAILRDRPLPLSLGPTERSTEERRRSIIALDRKRRLTNPNSYEEGRRRTNSGGFHDRRFNYDASRTDGLPSPPAPRRHASSDANVNRPLPEAIDLTGSSPSVLEPRTARRNRTSRTSSDNFRQYLVPRWQPDSEVNKCPICKRPFTWIFRRHHCRKCGRVVCNDCSPHRITIPRQFIVHPPGFDQTASSQDSNHGRSDSTDTSGDDVDETTSRPRRYSMQMEGGEKVRLCNPCVPDPQPDPLPNYPPIIPDNPGHEVSWSTRRSNIPAMPSNTIPRGHSAGVGTQSRNLPVGANPYFPQYRRPTGAVPTGNNTDTRGEVLTLFSSYRGQSSPLRYRMHASPTALNPPSFPGSSSREYTPQDPRAIHNRPRLSQPEKRVPRDEMFGLPSQSNRPPRPLHEVTHSAAVRPQLNENDLCPVCRRALPPLDSDGGETARETHIIDCINSRDPTYHDPIEISGVGAGGEASSSSQIQSPYRLHMLAFTATEKDCVSQGDGHVQECSICMVEYNVGDELARLECLCKFHRACIMEWVERKAECPVHKLIG